MLWNIFDNIVAISGGSLVTLKLFFITVLISIPLGLLVSLGKISKNLILGKLIDVYIWLMRGTPLLLQIFFVFFGLPIIGINLDRFPSAAIAFILNYAAYFAEIFRSGIQSIDKGQYEASDVLGLTYAQTMRRIILPQMIKRVLPPISNEIITLVKDTALVYTIGLAELMKAARDIVTRDFTVTPFFIAAAFYLLMTMILTKLFNWLEKKYSYFE